jgi:methylmalonyl-CoA mutase
VSLAGGFGELRAARFGGALAELDGRVVHEAGGSEAQELASVLAAAAWWLRALAENGVSAEAALPQVAASLTVDRDQFVSVAKLRAMRLLWARLAELCGAPGVPLSIHGETSRRTLTRTDPHTNLVRTTIAAIAAALAGADTISVVPFDAALGLPGASARALARNTHHLLIEESHLHRVADPGAGSGLVESLTDALAETAWSEFQQLEREGGILESLAAGALQARIAEKREALAAEVASGSAPLVGATIFAHPDGAPRGESEAVPGRPSFGGLAPVSLEDLAQGTA